MIGFRNLFKKKIFNLTDEKIKIFFPSHLKNVLLPEGECNENEINCHPTCVRCNDNTFYIDTNESGSFVKLECIDKDCDTDFVLFDANKHGWNGYVCNEKYPNEPVHRMCCPECQNDHFALHMRINSKGKDNFTINALHKDSNSILLESDWVNAFSWIGIFAVCDNCNNKIKVSNFKTM